VSQDPSLFVIIPLVKNFWIVYIAVAVVGSVVVWYTSPLARPSMSRKKNKAEPVAVAEAAPSQSAMLAAASTDVTSTPEDKKSVPAKTASTASESREDPPALLGIYRVTGKGKPEWGVVRAKTNFYNEQGQRLGEVPAGLIIKFVESRKSSKGTMVFCKFQYKGKIHGSYLVKRTDMTLFTGNYMDLSKNQRDNFESYYKILGMMEERKIEVMQAMAKKNPYYTQYKAAYDRYMDNIEQAKKMTYERDKATGLKRSNLNDKLRRMKNEQIALEKAYKKIHKKYKSWKVANNVNLPDSGSDPKIKEYRMEMRRLAKHLPGLAY